MDSSRGIFSPILMFMLLLLTSGLSVGQQFPSQEEGIPWLITFGKQAATSWGDDDFSQSFFFVIPPSQKHPVYIRVLDPETGGLNDELKGVASSTTRIAVYGGKECVSHVDVQRGDPVGHYDAGSLLAEKTFGSDAKYDNQ